MNNAIVVDPCTLRVGRPPGPLAFESSEGMGNFLGMISHELRNPLAVIIGSLRTALKEERKLTRKEVRGLVNAAADEADSMRALLEDLLELTRAQAGGGALRREPVDLELLATVVIARARSHHPGHRFANNIRPGSIAAGDFLRIRSVLWNLVDNAAKYSPSGSEVRASAEREDGRWVVGISDDGPGISEEDQVRLFQPFERLGQTIAGNGIGLIVCRTLVEAHGGKIWVQSSPGTGATFFFSLPAGEVRPPAAG